MNLIFLCLSISVILYAGNKARELNFTKDGGERRNKVEEDEFEGIAQHETASPLHNTVIIDDLACSHSPCEITESDMLAFRDVPGFQELAGNLYSHHD